MTYNNGKLPFKVQFDNTRVNKRYSFDGKLFFNRGELSEIAYRYAVTGKLDAYCDNTAFNMGCDVCNTSVKSPRATLTACKLGTDLDTILFCFFAFDASEQYAWVVMDTLERFHYYTMNPAEFENFIRNWGYLTVRDGKTVVRFPENSPELEQWLEDRVG